MNKYNDLELLDCTLRDGGYINNWDFSEDFGFSLYGAVSDSGCSFIEIGFFNPHGTHGAVWTNCSSDLVRRLKASRSNGAGIAVMIDFGSCVIGDVPPPADYPVDLIRVATPKKTREAATEFAAELGRMGYATTVNYMAVTEYTNEEILDLVRVINKHKNDVRYFYVADSFGSLLPARAREMFSALTFGTDANLGFHPHNNLQLAFANSLEAIDAGFRIVDGSIYGMGRGAGNLFLEAALAYMEKQSSRFKLLPVLQFADLFVDALKDKYDWGYSLPQLISGVLSCHPNYPTNLLAEKLYTPDEIYYMLQKLDVDKRSRYSKDILNDLKRRYASEELNRARHQLSEKFQALVSSHSTVLLLAGGNTVKTHVSYLERESVAQNCLVMAINNPQTTLRVDCVFFANRRRLLQHYMQIDRASSVVFSQSIHDEAAEQFGLCDATWLNVATILPEVGSPFPTIVPSNSAVEAILALVSCGIKTILVAGLDGFGISAGSDYYNEALDAPISAEEAALRNATLHSELKICRDIVGARGAEFHIVTPTLFSEFK